MPPTCLLIPQSTHITNLPSPQPRKNTLIQSPSHQILRKHRLTPTPVPLMLSIKRLHRRTHAAQSLPTAAPAHIGRRTLRNRHKRSLPCGLGEERVAAHASRQRVLLLLLLMVGHYQRLAGDVVRGRLRWELGDGVEGEVGAGVGGVGRDSGVGLAVVRCVEGRWSGGARSWW
jgi:hypothetical protein